MQNSVRCRSNGDGAVEMQWTVQWQRLCCDGATAMLCSKETVQGRQGSAASSTGSIDVSAVKMLAVRWVYGGCAQWQYNGCAVAVLCGWAQWLCSGSDIKVTFVLSMRLHPSLQIPQPIIEIYKKKLIIENGMVDQRWGTAP
ncbi:hypothetical protein FF1_002763 [Malus domestica]